MGADITGELHTIRQGRYGGDIRIAIHDALEKIASLEVEPTPGPSGVTSTVCFLMATVKCLPAYVPVIPTVDMVGMDAIAMSTIVEEG